MRAARRETRLSSLRTRLFLTVGLVLAAAIAASSLLSRQATLVEVRTVVTGPIAIDAGEMASVGAQIETVVQARGSASSAEVTEILEKAERASGRPWLFVDSTPRVIGASNPPLAASRLKRATPDGTLSLGVADGGQESGLELRGAPVRVVRGLDGQPAGYLFLLPSVDEEVRGARQIIPPPWILTTAAIALVALLLTFALSRRILQPVSALTAAADRMASGDLDVRVDVRGRDEVSNLSRAFNAMAARIGETERMRRQMVSDVAHELRSPVTNLRCTLESIQDGLLPPDRRSLDALHDETLFLQRLIGDLQELALADAGRLELHAIPVSIAAVVRSAAAPLMNTREAAIIQIDSTTDVPMVMGDADRLEQVFRNLLVNARTHTPANGRIDVHVGHEGGAVRVEVRDTGRGIAPDDLPHVFDRFYRADRSRARATGGAGLGLAIARQLIASHGGDLTAHSEGLGKGATFAVTLPAVR